MKNPGIHPEKKFRELSLEDLVAGRESTDAAVNKYYFEIIGCQIKRSDFRKFRACKLASDLFTAADEAFALLLLENNYDKWMMEFGPGAPKIGEEKDSSGKVIPSEKLDKRKRKYRELVTVNCRYTSQNRKVNGQMPGWSDEGKLRYNALLAMVKLTRPRTKSSEQMFMTTMIAELAEKNASSKKSIDYAHGMGDADAAGVKVDQDLDELPDFGDGFTTGTFTTV